MLVFLPINEGVSPWQFCVNEVGGSALNFFFFYCFNVLHILCNWVTQWARAGQLFASNSCWFCKSLVNHLPIILCTIFLFFFLHWSCQQPSSLWHYWNKTKTTWVVSCRTDPIAQPSLRKRFSSCHGNWKMPSRPGRRCMRNMLRPGERISSLQIL